MMSDTPEGARAFVTAMRYARLMKARAKLTYDDPETLAALNDPDLPENTKAAIAKMKAEKWNKELTEFWAKIPARIYTFIIFI